MASGTARWSIIASATRRCPTGLPDLDGFDYFNKGNPIRAFIGDRGFLVFDASVSLVDAFRRQMEMAAAQSLRQMHALPDRGPADPRCARRLRPGAAGAARSRRDHRAGPPDDRQLALRARAHRAGGAARGLAAFPRRDRGRDRDGAAAARAAGHGLHDRALYRGLSVQDQCAALYRLCARRQARVFAWRHPAEIPDGRDLRTGLRALLRDGLPARAGR